MLYASHRHKWRFYRGSSENKVDGETVIEKWDFITLPARLWRGFEVLPGQDGPTWLFAVLEPHDVFAFKDPYWVPFVVKAAEELGYEADEAGKRVKTPPERARLEREILERIKSRE